MRNLSGRVLAATVLSLSLPALAAAEDLTIVSSVTVGKGTPSTSTQYISAAKVRSSDGENDTIFDVPTGRIQVINYKKKEYFEFTRDEMTQALQELEQQMSGPAAGLFEKMTGGKMSDVTVQKTGATRKVAGYDCDSYVVSMGENLRYEICAATSIQPPLAYYDALKGPYSLMGPLAKRFEKLFEEMKKVKGFPVAMDTIVNLGMLKQNVKSEATEIRKGAIPASAFALPVGYKKKDSPFKKK